MTCPEWGDAHVRSLYGSGESFARLEAVQIGRITLLPRTAQELSRPPKRPSFDV